MNSAMEKAGELKAQKDKLQLDLVSRAIEPYWNAADTEGRGFLTKQQCSDLALSAMTQMGKADYFNEKAFLTAFDSIMLAGEMAAGRVTIQDLKKEAKERGQGIAEEVAEDVKKAAEDNVSKSLEDGKLDQEDVERVKESAK